MAPYKCPLCGKAVARDAALFLDHTHQHVIDEIKKGHPDWVESDGTCEPCAEYFEKQLSGEIDDANIGPNETRKRYVTGFMMSVISIIVAVWAVSSGASNAYRLLLFFPLFGAIFCLMEAKMKTCSVLAELGSRNMDTGTGKIENTDIAAKLKSRGRCIILQSAVAAGTATALFLLIP